MDRKIPTLCLAWLLFAAATHAAPPVTFLGGPHRPLLYVTYSFQSLVDEGTISYGTIFFFADGLVLETSGARDFGDVTADRTRIARAASSPQQLRALRRALTAARAGQQADCHFDPEALVKWELRLQWFGRGERQNTFVTSSRLGLPECPPEVQDLVFSLGEADVFWTILETVSG